MANKRRIPCDGISFLDIDHKNEAGYLPCKKLLAMAEEAASMFHYGRAVAIMAKMKWRWCRSSGEYAFLRALTYVARNRKGDYGRALVLLKGLEIGIGRRLKRSDRLSVASHGCMKAFLAKVLYVKANTLYYMESDSESLKTYRKCLRVAETCSASRRKGMSLFRLTDVRRKIASLEFMLSGSGLRCAEFLLGKWRFGETRATLDRAIGRCGVDYMDHEALIIAAIAHFAAGSRRRGRALIAKGYADSPGCMECRFLYAVSNLGSGVISIRRRAHGILRDIANGKAVSECKMAHDKQERIRKTAMALIDASGHGKGHRPPGSMAGRKGMDAMRDILDSVYVVHRGSHGRPR